MTVRCFAEGFAAVGGVMGRPLKSPPLVEALVEFRFAPTSEWDWTIPGRLFERIRDEFPTRVEVRPFVMVGAGPGGPPESAPPVPAPERLQFKRADGTAMVQVGPRLMVVNHLKPYPNWENFRDLVLKIFDIHASVTGPLPIARIGMRYINHLPSRTLDLEKEITILAPVRTIMDAPFNHFYQRYDLQIEEPKGTLVHQCGTAFAGTEMVTMLDLDFFSTEPGEASDSDGLRAWLDSAHDRIEEAFRSSLSDSLYQRLDKGS